MPSIELRLRAYPAVLVDGHAVPLALKRGLALLAVLAELGRKVARVQLGELLWPDAAVDVGRARLRRLVHETNQVLGIDGIVGDGDALWLAGPFSSVVSDVERLRRFARQLVTAPADAPSREALQDLLQPDAHQVLEGFEFGADSFDAWLGQRRSDQHRLVARALQRAGEQLIASGRPLLAAEAAARLVAIEPLADAGHALLLRACAKRGDFAAMESAYLAFAELDRRGVGLSERLAPAQSVPAGVEDLDAVRQAVGADKVWLFGNSVGSMIAIEYAALHGEAVQGLVLYAASARGAWAPDYPWAPTAAQLQICTERLRADWGSATSLREFAPSQADNPVARDWWARLLRQAMSRNSQPMLLREFGRMDVRHRLPQVHAPTLVLQREGDRVTRPGAARFLAEQIAGARLQLLPGEDHNMWAGDVGAVIDEVERFVEGASA